MSAVALANLRRAPRVAVSITDFNDPYLGATIRGRVAEIDETEPGPQRWLRARASEYTGADFPAADLPEAGAADPLRGRAAVLVPLRFDETWSRDRSTAGPLSAARFLALISRRIATTFVPFLLSGLLLAACATAEAPDLSVPRNFRAFAVYYAGVSVADLPLEEVLGDPTKSEDKRDLAWIFVYGHCENPPGEGGCPVPLQIHDYSTCNRWAGTLPHRGHLIDFRGAKAYRSRKNVDRAGNLHRGHHDQAGGR